MVSGCSGSVPEHFVKLYEAYQKGDMKEAQRDQKKAAEICEVLQNGTDMGIFKAALSMHGIRGGHMCRPLIDLEVDEVKENLY